MHASKSAYLTIQVAATVNARPSPVKVQITDRDLVA